MVRLLTYIAIFAFLAILWLLGHGYLSRMLDRDCGATVRADQVKGDLALGAVSLFR